jgi:hypothetical protein
MRRTYGALAIVAAVAIVVNALAPAFSLALQSGFLVRSFAVNLDGIRTAVNLGSLLMQMALLIATALTASTATFAVVVAAQTGRRAWMAPLAALGALAVFGPVLPYALAPMFNVWAIIDPFDVFQMSVAQAALPVTAAALALVFALTGMRQARAPRVVAEA